MVNRPGGEWRVMDSGNRIITRISVILVVLGFWISINERLNAHGQQQTDRTTTKSMANVRPVNLFVINDEDNEIANKSVESSLRAMRVQHPGYLGKVVTVTINGSDPKYDLEIICSAWKSSIDEKSSESSPDLLLDTTRTGYGTETVNTFAAALGIPTLSAQFGQQGDLRQWRDLTTDQKDYLVQVMPPADLIPEIIRQLAIDMKISNAAVIFDSDYVMEHKYKSLLLNVPTRHVITSSKSDAETTRNLFKRLRELDIVNYFLLTGEENLSTTLDVAQKLNYTGRKYGWYALTQDDFEPRCDCQNLSLLFFKPKLTSTSQQRLGDSSNQRAFSRPKLASAFYYDLARLAVLASRKSIENEAWPVEPKHIDCDYYNGNNTPSRNYDFLEILKRTTEDENFEATFADFQWGTENGQHQANFNMSITMIGMNNGNPSFKDELGSWKAGIGNPLEVWNKSTIENHTAVTSFRIVTVEKAPFMMYDSETQEWSGYCIDLINHISQILHFEYEIFESPDKKFGTMDAQGNWNGMIRELKEKRADIALGALSVMAERENVVDFTVPYYDLVGISILMSKPKAETSLFKFLTVLENEVWLCILASYFFTSFLMWVFDRWSPYSYQNNREKYREDDEKREFSLRECFWFCMTSLTPQGGGEAPKNLSGRLVAATWWLFGFIIIASYTANLAAFLTVSRLETPVESLDDLSKQYKVQYAPIQGSEAYTYFERMSNIEGRFYEIWKDMSLNDSLSDVERAKFAVWDYPVSDKYTKMFQAMKEATFPADMKEALRRVRRMDPAITNEFAFVGDATDIRYLAMTNCDLIMVGEEFSRKPYAIAVQQGSALKDQINNAILQLLNQRTLEKLKNDWWSQNPNKKICEKQDDQSDGISIENIGGVFIVIFVGIGLSCVTLTFEYWWYRYRPKHRKPDGSGNPKMVKIRDAQPVKFTLKPAKTPAFPESVQFRSRF